MIATITNTTSSSFTLPLFNEWMTPFEVYTIRRSFSNFNDLITGPRGSTFLYLVELGIITVVFTVEAQDSFVPFLGGGGGTGTVTSITAGAGLSGGTITNSGTIAVAFGSSAGTVCEGNDPRLNSGATIPAPAGPYAFAAGTPVAVHNGVLVAANASNPDAMPCIGFYTGSVLNSIQPSGSVTGLTGLTANSPVYISASGGLTTTPPTAPNTVSQYVGKALSATSMFASIQTPVYR